MNALDMTPTQRADLAGFLNDVERLEAIFATWEETPRGAVEAYARAIEALHGEALTAAGARAQGRRGGACRDEARAL